MKAWILISDWLTAHSTSLAAVRLKILLSKRMWECQFDTEHQVHISIKHNATWCFFGQSHLETLIFSKSTFLTCFFLECRKGSKASNIQSQIFEFDSCQGPHLCWVEFGIIEKWLGPPKKFIRGKSEILWANISHFTKLNGRESPWQPAVYIYVGASYRHKWRVYEEFLFTCAPRKKL